MRGGVSATRHRPRARTDLDNLFVHCIDVCAGKVSAHWRSQHNIFQWRTLLDHGHDLVIRAALVLVLRVVLALLLAVLLAALAGRKHACVLWGLGNLPLERSARLLSSRSMDSASIAISRPP